MIQTRKNYFFQNIGEAESQISINNEESDYDADDKKKKSKKKK